jgi:hypothetical protein
LSEVCDVPVEHLEMVWPRVRKFVSMALDRGSAGKRYYLSDVLDLLLEQKARLWVVWNPQTHDFDGAAITETLQHPRCKETRILFVGGRNMKQWGRAGHDMIEAFARDQGCSILSGAMRRGWTRIGGPGWVETGVTFEKVL